MSVTISFHDAEHDLARWVEQAHAGQEVVLTKNGQPYARLMPPVAPQGQRRAGRLAGKLGDAFFEPLPPEELDAWEGRAA